MKKLVLIILILLSGCATTKSYTGPEELRVRSLKYAALVSYCMNDRIQVQIVLSDELNASMDADGNLALTEGLLKQNDPDALYFFTAHEIAHKQLNHVRKRRGASLVTTGIMMVVGTLIPGAGILNHAINPAVVNNFSKPQELEADKLASQTLVSCFNIPVDRQINLLYSMKARYPENGGFWSTHPSWDERIQNIQGMK